MTVPQPNVPNVPNVSKCSMVVDMWYFGKECHPDSDTPAVQKSQNVPGGFWFVSLRSVAAVELGLELQRPASHPDHSRSHSKCFKTFQDPTPVWQTEWVTPAAASPLGEWCSDKL